MWSPRGFLDAALKFILWCVIVGTVVHEYGHLLAIRLVGGVGVIYSWQLDAMHFIEVPDAYLWFVYLGGGLWCFLVFMVAQTWCNDDEDRLVFRFTALMNLGYGICESAFSSGEVAFSAVFGMVFAATMLYLWRWRVGKKAAK